MRVVLLSSRARAGTSEVLAQVRATIARHATVVGEFDVNDTLPPDLKADRAVVIGGDGSIMAALRIFMAHATPVVGVNTGRLGFLAEFDTASLETHATAIFGANPLIRQRMVLAVSVRAADSTTRYEGLAVNDCVVTAGAPFRMIELALRLDGENGPEFLGDGIIIATPVGSTAYNASAGGPIVHPDVEAIIVTPNAAHSLAFRPVVVPAGLAVQAHVVRANEGTTLVLDGHINVSLRVGDTVVAKRHHDMARIVARPDSSYWETLVDKMRWAESPNYRAPGA
jgi:NAD+ kinase